MLKRRFFITLVVLGLVVSAAHTAWTSDLGNSVRSWPPDTTRYARPAVPDDLMVSRGAGGPLSGLALVPGSPGGEPDIAVGPCSTASLPCVPTPPIVIHAGFGGWNGNAPNFVSSDGGKTWTRSFQIPPPAGAPNTAGCPCDITQDYGLDGNLYGAYLTLNTDVFSASNTNPFALLFNYFLVGGVAQRTDFNGTLGFADQPWLLTGKAVQIPSVQTNTYVGYDDFSRFPNVGIRVAVALGTQPPNFVKDNASGVSTGGGINPGHRLAVDPFDGTTIYSLYQICSANCGGSPKTITYMLNQSGDAGSTWSLNGSPTGIPVATGVTVQPTPKFGTVNALLGGIDHATVDSSSGDVFVVYGDSNGLGGNAIFIKRIAILNNTASVGPAQQVSLPGAEAALPSVAIDHGLTVAVLYTSFDGFTRAGAPIFSAHLARSSTTPLGPFDDDILLSFVSPAKDNGDPRQRVLGDYQQLKTIGSTLFVEGTGFGFYGVFTGNSASFGQPTAQNDAIFFKVPPR